MGATRAGVVGVVFAVSLAALAASSVLALSGSTDELAARDRLRAAAAELAASARDLPPDHTGVVLPESDNRRLAEIARRVLVNYTGTEGGFYFPHSDQFAGAVVSGSDPPEPLSVDQKAAEKKDADKKIDKKKDAKKEADKKAAVKKEPEQKEGVTNGGASRREPPPLEAPSIRLQCRAVDLNAITAETLELVRAGADAQGVVIESEFAPDLPPVSGAAQALGQVVLNLVTNALHAMPAGGRLLCRTVTLPGGRVELAVSDTGPGVPAEARERLFEPFFTTRPDGTGLGLALCREVARQHGGDVTLDPPGGAGATFRLTLPTGGVP